MIPKGFTGIAYDGLFSARLCKPIKLTSLIHSGRVGVRTSIRPSTARLVAKLAMIHRGPVGVYVNAPVSGFSVSDGSNKAFCF